MACVILSSSWPDFTVTLISGWLASKSSTTVWIAAASRSVKKCQNSMLPDAVTPGEAIGFVVLELGVHAARPSTAVAVASTTVARRRSERGISFSLRGGGGGVGRSVTGGPVDLADQVFADDVQPGVQRAEQHRVVRQAGGGDLGLQRSGGAHGDRD